jgi:AcrR family transcriptional regulator
MSVIRMEAEDRRAQLVETGLEIAQSVGWYKVTRRAVAEKTATAEALINRYFDNKDGFRDALMEEAVKRRLVPLVAEGLMYMSKPALAAPDRLRKQARTYLQNSGMKLPRWRVVTETGVQHAWAK